MAYGDLKVNNLIYDTGSGDATRTVISIPQTASPTFTGNITINAQGDFRFADSDSSNYVGFQAPATVTSNLVWTLPAADGSANQLLKTDGSGNLGWATDSATDSTKLPLAGGTMSGDINLGTNDITNGGTITGTFSGNLTGNVTGNASGTAATVTGAAQANITSVGTLTGLTVAGNYAQTLTTDGGFTATAAGNHAISITGDANRSADSNTLISIHGKWNGTKVATIDFQAGDDTTNKDNGQIVFYTAAAGSEAVALTIAEDKSATFTGTVSDSKGDVRSIPANAKTGAYTLIASDAGKVIPNTTGGWTVPASVLGTGDTITLLNDSGSAQNITASALTYLYNVTDGANIKASTIALGARGMATIWFGSGTVGYIQSAALTVS
jgi:hypothetical protein